jgi:nucleotide-binding universal stress UspA family protein
MFRRILVTLDGSEFAEAALPAAAAIARKSGGELRLVTVEDPGWRFITESGWAYIDSDAEAAARAAAAAYMESTRARMLESCPRVTTVVRAGYPVDEIIAEADEYDADVVVMATHGRGAMSSLWLGSVTNQCMRHIHKPMLLVRPDEGAAGRPEGLALQRLVVPLDGSEFSERALGPAIGLANLFGSRIELTRLVHDLSVADPEFFPHTVAHTTEIVEHDRAAASEYLEHVAEPLRAWGLAVATHAAPAPEAAPAVVSEAQGDVIVMSTHARSGLERAFLGSVAQSVVRASEGPVLVIPPQARPDQVEAAPEPRGREQHAV